MDKPYIAPDSRSVSPAIALLAFLALGLVAVYLTAPAASSIEQAAQNAMAALSYTRALAGYAFAAGAAETWRSAHAGTLLHAASLAALIILPASIIALAALRRMLRK